MDNVVHIGDIKNDNRLITVETSLECALKSVKAGECRANKSIVLLLNKDGDTFDPSYFAANLSASEAVALLSYYQQYFIDILRGK